MSPPLVSPPTRRHLLTLAALLVLPLSWLGRAWGSIIGHDQVDLRGHIWTVWSVSEGAWPESQLLNHPQGIDLLPIVGGWLDLLLGGLLLHWLPMWAAYDLVLVLYGLLAGLGGYALARVAGARSGAALVAGLLLQLDGFIWSHLIDGRPEQAGLGAVALALAGATWCWQQRGWRPVVAAALAGALVVLVSWELALFTAMAVIWLALVLALTSSAPWPRLRRSLAALALFTVLIGPWVLRFMAHSLPVRGAQGGDEVQTALMSSAGLLDWWMTPERPVIIGLIALLLVPPLIPAVQRRAALLLGLGLLGTLLLALGPSPRLWGPPQFTGTLWGPFLWLQRVPVLGWFDWPQRLLVGFSLAAPVAAALLLSRLHRGQVAAAGIVLSLGLAEATFFRRPLTTELELEPHPAMAALAALPDSGGVVYLPLSGPKVPPFSRELLQLQHHRPVLNHGYGLELVDEASPAAVAPLRAWSSAFFQRGRHKRSPPHPGLFTPLVDLGIGYAVLDLSLLGRPQGARAHAAISEALGSPILEEEGVLAVWSLPAPGS